MSPGVFDGTLLRDPHPMFDFRESLLNGVQIRRVWRQEPKSGSSRPYCLTDCLGLVAPEVVEDDDVAGLECGDQLLVDPCAETLPIDRAIEDAGSCETIATQGRDEGHGAPVAVRRVTLEPLASCTPAAQRSHIGLDPGLVDEDEPAGIKIGHEAFPASSAAGDVSARLLDGEQAFF